MADYSFDINGVSYTFSELFQPGAGSGTSDFYENGIELLQQFETGFSQGTYLQNNNTNYEFNETDIVSQLNPVRGSYASSSQYSPVAVSVPSWCTKIGFLLIGAGGGGSSGYNQQFPTVQTNGGDGGGGSSAMGIYNITSGYQGNNFSFQYNLNVGGSSNIVFNDNSNTTLNTTITVYTGTNGNLTLTYTTHTTRTYTTTYTTTTTSGPASIQYRFPHIHTNTANLQGTIIIDAKSTGGTSIAPSPSTAPTYVSPYYTYVGSNGSNGSRLYTPSGYKNAPASIINNLPPVVTGATNTSHSIIGWGNKGGNYPNYPNISGIQTGRCSNNATPTTSSFIQYWCLY